MYAFEPRNARAAKGTVSLRGTAREALPGMQRLGGLLGLVLTAAVALPASALARGSMSARVVSPCGRHVLAVAPGQVLVDGRPVWSAPQPARMVSAPVWRRDGRAVAWVERDGRETRLVVVSWIGSSPGALPWPLPALASRDRVFWASSNRVVVGPHLLAPRAVASWSETGPS